MSLGLTVVLIAVVIALALGGWIFYSQQRKKALRSRFGPEYSTAVKQYGNESKAVDALAARERRIEKLHIKPLTREEQQLFVDQWQTVQRDFIDDPAASIERADILVGNVLRARGYPMADFEHRAEDISVDHPDVVANFRAAHAIAGRQQRGQATTEDLRQALVHYRNLFDDLLEAHPAVVNRRTKI